MPDRQLPVAGFGYSTVINAGRTEMSYGTIIFHCMSDSITVRAELPGQGDPLIPQPSLTLPSLRQAAAAVAPRMRWLRYGSLSSTTVAMGGQAQTSSADSADSAASRCSPSKTCSALSTTVTAGRSE